MISLLVLCALVVLSFKPVCVERAWVTCDQSKFKPISDQILLNSFVLGGSKSLGNVNHYESLGLTSPKHRFPRHPLPIIMPMPTAMRANKRAGIPSSQEFMLFRR